MKSRAAGAGARRARCRSTPATCRSAWSTSPAATPSAPASRAAIDFNGGDALERPAPALPPDLPGTLMLNPPYGERIDVGRQGGAGAIGDARRRQPRDWPTTSSPVWRRTGSAPTRRIPPAGRAWVLSPDLKLPSAHAAEGIAPRADVERTDRVPAVPLRPGRGVDAAGSGRAPDAGLAAAAPTARAQQAAPYRRAARGCRGTAAGSRLLAPPPPRAGSDRPRDR